MLIVLHVVITASLENADMLPYAEYLREAKRNNKPMPVLFTLDCQDTRLIAEIKVTVIYRYIEEK